MALKGFHKYFKKASDEEREHAEKVRLFLKQSSSLSFILRQKVLRKFSKTSKYVKGTKLFSFLLTAHDVPKPTWRSHCASGREGIAKSLVFS